jgi:hypothetical protein
MEPRQGLVCSLTDKKADFEGTCPDFDKDEEEAEYVLNQRMAASGAGIAGVDNLADYDKNKKMGTALLFGGIALTVGTFMLSDITGFFILSFGALIVGAGLMLKGAQQEKLFREMEEANEEDTENNVEKP